MLDVAVGSAGTSAVCRVRSTCRVVSRWKPRLDWSALVWSRVCRVFAIHRMDSDAPLRQRLCMRGRCAPW